MPASLTPAGSPVIVRMSRMSPGVRALNLISWF
jgi:hypothetical protein